MRDHFPSMALCFQNGDVCILTFVKKTACLCGLCGVYVQVLFYSLAALDGKILFSPLEDKIHICAPPCNIPLYRFKV